MRYFKMSSDKILAREKKLLELDEWLMKKIAKLGSSITPKYADIETIHEIIEIQLLINSRPKYLENYLEVQDDFQEIDEENQARYAIILEKYIYRHPDFQPYEGDYNMPGDELPRVWDKYIGPGPSRSNIESPIV